MCCCVESINRRVMFYAPKDKEKNIFLDDITFITLSRSSDLLLRKSTNLNNNPRTICLKDWMPTYFVLKEFKFCWQTCNCLDNLQTSLIERNIKIIVLPILCE